MSTVDTFEVNELADAVSPYSKERSNQISAAYCRAAAPLMERIFHLVMVEGLRLKDVRRPQGGWLGMSTVQGRRLTVGFEASHDQRITYHYDPKLAVPVVSETNHDAEALQRVPRRARKSQGYWFGKLVALVADMEVYWSEYSPEKTIDCRSLGAMMLTLWNNLEQVMQSGLLTTYLPPTDELGLEMQVRVPKLSLTEDHVLQFQLETSTGLEGILLYDRTVSIQDRLAVSLGISPKAPDRAHKEWYLAVRRLLWHVCTTLGLQVNGQPNRIEPVTWREPADLMRAAWGKDGERFMALLASREQRFQAALPDGTMVELSTANTREGDGLGFKFITADELTKGWLKDKPNPQWSDFRMSAFVPQGPLADLPPAQWREVVITILQQVCAELDAQSIGSI